MQTWLQSLMQHDIGADFTALVVCMAAAFTTSVKLEHALLDDGRIDRFKLAFASLALGFGSWAANFIGLLSFAPTRTATFDIFVTVASLMLSIGGAGLALRVLVTGQSLQRRLAGGTVAALTFAITHVLAFLAVRGWQIKVDWSLAIAGTALAMVLGAFAGWTPRDQSLRGKALRAGMLVSAFLAVHFVAAASIDLTVGGSGTRDVAFTNELLGRMVAMASALVLIMSLWAAARETRRRAWEAEALHLRELADAVLEGLVIVDADTIVASNRAFETLVGKQGAVGRQLSDYIAATDLEIARAQPGAPVETVIELSGGSAPIEIVVSPVHFRGQDRDAIAVRDLSHRRQAEDQIRFLAHNDALTGLLNRTSFSQKLELDLTRLRRAQDKLAVLYLDLDRFKQVNDIFGHAAGDAVLREVAVRIQETLGEDDSFARLGGDEFAIIRTQDVTPEGLDKLCTAILAAVALAFDIGGGQTALLGASIGVAVTPDKHRDGAGLIAQADAALYEAKAGGRNTYRFFEPALAEALRARQCLEQDLRQAIDAGQLHVVYQPQARISEGVIDGFEALARWEHPTKGPVSPDQFIPIAEESGLIFSIGEWVLRQACADAAAWPSDQVVSVNLSAVQLHSTQLPNLVHSVLIQSGLPARRLELEITETALIKNGTRALHVLRQLKALGVSIAMDDFGTGFSSLSNLRNYPIDTIKIDGSFVRGVDLDHQSATIVRAVLGLGGGLGMKVIAEGVETQGEEAFLIGEGCDYAQGYLYGRPAKSDGSEHVPVRARA